MHLSNWLRTLQLPQLTGGLLTNVKQISVWFGLGPICLGVGLDAEPGYIFPIGCSQNIYDDSKIYRLLHFIYKLLCDTNLKDAFNL